MGRTQRDFRTLELAIGNNFRDLGLGGSRGMNILFPNTSTQQLLHRMYVQGEISVKNYRRIRIQRELNRPAMAW